MTDRWYYRKAHTRRLSTGRTVSVRGGWAVRGDRESKKGASFRRTCPICGALIVSVGMPRGGWVHFEGGKGLTRIKHPCLHLGEGLSRRRDEDTPDLFEARLPF
ncbi:hypothetical protein SAMN04488117_11678 [Celeribacter baekdonensis]|jgi:hypothetical protein|uniref:Uncharacterized protein n=1 Tax=Celeribacter baekdonensis TaxID=875171 RepID=A0A1G7TAG5_9RHOB|nr:hypothetical protein SAMN04488117_11678 [Celeribacter baekdonensis]